MTEPILNEQTIFLAALEIATPDERAAYIEGACAENITLLARVNQLLRSHNESQGPLDLPPPGILATIDDPFAERPGTVIGPYKLLEQIGEGGFGVVFMAEQMQPVRRKVALKILKPGMDTRQVVARFEAERQALAIMDHPNIAKVHDGGATASGRPFFVMELVKGVAITEHCDQNHLTPRERLTLFVSVCQAVQHAHHKGIIHRDLKPSNVLVTMHDTTPLVKVIDFGVAKALGQELTDKTLFTGFAQMIGTPLYMSPEQAGQSNLDIDTRSDIYSLGVLLYELLTGTTPFGKERFKQAAYDEIRRIIREEEPPKPSSRLSTTDALASIAANRHMEPRKLTGLVRGELDWIVMKCLDKDRNRRYETANGFAADVQRYLNAETVQACPPSAWYRFRKFARRNKVSLAMGALITTAMILTVVVLAVSNVWVRQERDQKEEALRQKSEALTVAEANFRKARAAVDKSFTLVSESDLFEAMGLQPLRKQLLEAALQYYREFADQRPDDPKLKADLAAAHFRMWQVYKLIDEYSESVAALRQALDIVDQLRRDQAIEPEVLQILGTIKYGAPYFHSTWSDRGPGAEHETIRTLRRAAATWKGLASDHPEIPAFQLNLVHVYDELANILRFFTPSEALLVAETAYETRERLDRDRPTNIDCGRDTAKKKSVLAMYLMYAGRLQEAQEGFQYSLDRAEEQVARFPNGRSQLQKAASLHRRMGELLLFRAEQQQAEPYLRRAIALYEGLARDFPSIGNYRWYLSDCHDKLGNVLQATGRPQEAEQYHLSAVDQVQKLVADFPDNTAYLEHACTYQTSLARCLLTAGRRDDAEKLCRQVINNLEKLTAGKQVYSNERPYGFYQVGEVFRHMDRSKDAEHAYESAKKIWEEASAKFPDVPDYHEHLGHAHRWLNQPEEAVAVWSKAIEKWPNDNRFFRWRAAVFCDLGQLERAMADLREAFRKGYADLAQLKNDPSFKPLRSRDDFKKLLSDIENEKGDGKDPMK